MSKVAKDSPLSEITLRRYEKPAELSNRDKIKKICLSLGLLQPGDSRDIIVDVLAVLLESSRKKEFLSSEQITSYVADTRKELNLPLKGIASSNIRRQTKRLKDLFIIENINNKYRITEFDSLDNIFQEKIKPYYIQNIISRIQDYLKTIK